MQQIDAKIIEIQNNKAVEYLHPLAQLEKQLAMKKKVAGKGWFSKLVSERKKVHALEYIHDREHCHVLFLLQLDTVSVLVVQPLHIFVENFFLINYIEISSLTL